MKIFKLLLVSLLWTGLTKMQNFKLKPTIFLSHLILLNLLFFLSPSASWARPEYALKTTTVNCNVCHLNPFGGGARTIFGKAFGSFGLKPAPYSKQDLFSADLRAVGYIPPPQSKKTNYSGFLLMNVQGTLNAPLSPFITDEPDDGIKTNLVINFTSSEMNTTAGETFLLIEPNPKMQLVIGKFIRPYGLLSDEHRTFIRMQTKTSSLDYESGIGLAHQVFDTWHFDLAYTNNSTPSTRFQNEPTWGTVFNLRWTPYFMPVMLGTSMSHTIRPAKKDSYAQSLYGGFSFDRATNYTVPVTITFEASKAQGWNGEMTPYSSYFFDATADAAYYNSIINKKSLGFYSQVLWNIKPHIALLYKFDQLLLDEKYPADAFERHGIGTNWNMNSNLIFQVRMERAKNGRKDVSQAQRSAVDAFYFLIRAWM